MTAIPSILQLSRVPPNQRTIGLPGGKSILLSTFLDSWRKLKALPPTAEVSGWTWYPMLAQDILHAISQGVLDRINLRSGARLQWRDNSHRIEATRRARVSCSCRWCGSPLPTYQYPHARFCDQSCRNSYNS